MGESLEEERLYGGCDIYRSSVRSWPGKSCYKTIFCEVRHLWRHVINISTTRRIMCLQ